MRLLALAAVALCGAMMGCMHLKGVVYEDQPGVKGARPMRTATLSIGRPTGIAVYATHHVDKDGKFDLYIGPTDSDNIFLYDSGADPAMTMHRLDPSQLGENMVLRLRRGGMGSPALPGDININP